MSKYTEKLFCYVFRSSSSIASGSNDEQLITISKDFDFVLKEVRTNGTSGLFITLSDLAGEQYSDKGWDEALVGSGVNGIKFFDRELVLGAGSQIKCVFDNQTGGNITTSKEVQLWGFLRPR